jgi:hypothetical protein
MGVGTTSDAAGLFWFNHQLKDARFWTTWVDVPAWFLQAPMSLLPHAFEGLLLKVGVCSSLITVWHSLLHAVTRRRLRAAAVVDHS